MLVRAISPQHAPAREAPAGVALEQRVLPDREVADRTDTLAVFGDARDAGVDLIQDAAGRIDRVRIAVAPSTVMLFSSPRLPLML